MSEEAKQPEKELEREQDSARVRALLAGDLHSFDELVLRYQNRVFNLCYRFLGEYEEANDCAQEAFFKAFRSLKGFRFESAFGTWLYAIAVNTCKSRLKSAEYRYRKRTVSINVEREREGGAPSFEIADPAPSPYSQLAEREMELRLQRAIEQLPRDSRAVVILRDLEGLPYEEIAHITGYNLGTVKSKLARARQRLRKMLKEA